MKLTENYWHVFILQHNVLILLATENLTFMFYSVISLVNPDNIFNAFWPNLEQIKTKEILSILLSLLSVPTSPINSDGTYHRLNENRFFNMNLCKIKWD